MNEEKGNYSRSKSKSSGQKGKYHKINGLS